MTEIKIFSDGTKEGTRVVNMDTNTEIPCTSVTWHMLPNGKCEAQIVIDNCEIEAVGDLSEVRVSHLGALKTGGGGESFKADVSDYQFDLTKAETILEPADTYRKRNSR